MPSWKLRAVSSFWVLSPTQPHAHTPNVTTVTEVWSTSFGLVLHTHCSSIYMCMYCLFAGMWCPLVSVIKHYHVAKVIFHRWLWCHTLSLHYACIRSSGIPYATFVENFVSFAASIAELAHGKKSRTQSINQSPSLFDAPGTKGWASALAHTMCLEKSQQAMIYPQQSITSVVHMSREILIIRYLWQHL